MSQTPASGIPEIPGYRDLVRIGRGGFATVYLAREVAFERNVAIKVLDARDLADDALQRFERECRAVGSLSNQPGIVTVHTAGTTPEGRPYLVMEYLAGGTLGTRIKRSGPVPAAEVARLGVDLLAAIEAAHGLGIVHRDIKPDNILLTTDGRPVLGDFGISSMPGSYETGTGNTAATVGFAAPEIIDGARASVSSDLYSLAATLASALIGRALFSGGPEESLIAQINRILREDPPDLTVHGASREFDQVLRRSLAKDPASRYVSAADFRVALQQVVGLGAGGIPQLADTDTVVAADEIDDIDEAQAATLLRADLLRSVAAGPSLVGELSDLTERRTPPAASTLILDPAVSSQRPRRRAWLWVVGAASLVVVGGGVGVALGAGGDSRDPETVAAAVAVTTPALEPTSAPEPTPDPVVVIQRVLEVRGGTLEVSAVLKDAERCAGGQYRLQVRQGSWVNVRNLKLSEKGKTIDVAAPGRYRVLSPGIQADGVSCPAVRSRTVDVRAPAPAVPDPQPEPKPQPQPKPTLKDPVKPG